MTKKVVVVGASPNQSRYSYLAAEMLTEHEHEFVPIGIKKGSVIGKPILDIRTKPTIDNVDTITMYVRAELQREWTDYLISLKPRRIIFNPGAENPEFDKQANEAGIETIDACTLVMLRTGQF